MKALFFALTSLFLLLSNSADGQLKDRPTHLILLKNGASFKMNMVLLTDTALTYNSAGHISTIPTAEIVYVKALYLLQNNGRGIHLEDSNFTQPSKEVQNSQFIAYHKKYPIDDSTKNIIYFDLGAKFGRASDDGFVYLVSSFFLDAGYLFRLKPNIYLGPTVGLHPFSFYNTVFMPVRADFRFLLHPERNKSGAFNLGFGYGLSLMTDNPLKFGGVSYKLGYSRLRAKSPRRVNELSLGFTGDYFQSRAKFTFPVEIQHVRAARFYISKSWWFR